jgi:hypothetical protein
MAVVSWFSCLGRQIALVSCYLRWVFAWVAILQKTKNIYRIKLSLLKEGISVQFIQ